MNQDLEAFFVYRSLHSDESWDATITSAQISSLPNIGFGMRVFAKNKKEAITRGRYLYEKIHKLDSDIDNVKQFMSSILSGLIKTNFSQNEHEVDMLVSKSIDIAIKSNDALKLYFNQEGDDE